MERTDRWRVVRLFPDYADSVVWLRGPVAYADTGLSPELIADLRAWDDRFYAESRNYEERGSAAFWADGAPLAQRLADELGSDVEVDLQDQRYRGAGPGRPEAVAAFEALVAAGRAEELSWRRALGPGAPGEWRAEPPPDRPAASAR